LPTPWRCLVCLSGSFRVWSGLREGQFNQLAWYPRVTLAVSLAFSIQRSSGRCGAAQSGRLQVVRKIACVSGALLLQLQRLLSRCG
jgi:drug/metabolite transporter superfamily protein YnfA